MHAQLFPIEGGDPIELSKDLTVVGRREDCDLRLDHKSVSKMHCILVKTDGMLMVRDLGSTNGTRINGARIRRGGLLSNDHLAIASYKFKVVLGQGQPPSHRVHAHEHTQRIDASDFRKALAGGGADNNDSDEIELRPNQLPDAYPEEESKQ